VAELILLYILVAIFKMIVKTTSSYFMADLGVEG